MGSVVTNYLGLRLKNPVIVGSCGQTSTIESILALSDANPGAIVLKSLFEEQIENEAKVKSENYQDSYYLDTGTIETYLKNYSIDTYLELIYKAKQKTDTPIIASINCQTPGNWVSFAESIQQAGADAIELNVSVLPFNEDLGCNENESVYFEIIGKIKEHLNIPLSLKMSYYSSGLAKLIKRLSWTGDIQGMILFNRYYNPDIDINQMTITASNIFSTSHEYTLPLRWIALLSKKVECDLVGNTGIHSGETVAKMLLAGAAATQVVSAIYKNGPTVISKIVSELQTWMELKGYNSIEEFKGLLAHNDINHRQFERTQFMKHYGTID
ncbi:MAG: dihydroorotate dehydrogenase-like protein [Bacteroidales bacterium]